MDFSKARWFLIALAAVGLSFSHEGCGRASAADQREARVDLARSGVTLGEDFPGVEWKNPRDVYEVRLAFPEEKAGGTPEDYVLQWWGSIWPGNGSGGWMRLDDPWNGRWVSSPQQGVLEKESGDLVFRFPPLTSKEWDKALKAGDYADKTPPLYRRTLKVRVVSKTDTLSERPRLAVYGDSTWREGSFDIEARFFQDGVRSGRIEIFNGILIGMKSLPEPRQAEVDGDRWRARGVGGGSAGVRILVRYAETRQPKSNNLTRVTVRLGRGADATGFSFVPQDVLQEGAMRLPDLGVLVSPTTSGLTLANDPGPSSPHWEKTVRERIPDRPEASRESAMAGIPRLSPPRWVPLGAPSARQEFFISPEGNWRLWGLSLFTEARDTKRIRFRDTKSHPGEQQLDALIDHRSDPKFDGGDREDLSRFLEEDHLPLIHVRYRRGAIRYDHAFLATVLTGEIGDDDTRRGDEPVILLTKLVVENTTDSPQAAIVNVQYNQPPAVKLREDGIIEIVPPEGSSIAEGMTALRGQVSMGNAAGKPLPAEWSVGASGEGGESSILRWEATLAGKESRTIYFKAPYVELFDAAELSRLKEIEFDEEAEKVLGYWRERIAQGMRIELPDAALNSFYRANLWHNVITTDRDPKTGLYNQGVATVRYRVFGNETVMIARSMDMRGEHKEAERFLEPLLHYQGNEALTGRFSTKEGAFHSAGEYTHGKYAMNHGFVLWGVADHYLYTRDRSYLDRVAPALVKGCDFLISERRSTMGETNGRRSPIHGLSPASSLEDVIEYQYWLATNSYFHLGMKRAGQALSDIGHPQARRIVEEAESYRRDIEAASREAATRSAAVRLRNGEFVPYVPSRIHQWRHLTEGWIREALYPALHLATAEVVPPEDPLMTWMLDDLEDNIFFSGESGYNVRDVDDRWFELGAVTLQPCLLDTPPIYMARNEIPAALRSFWNTYALLIYPDVHCFAEWAPAFGRGGGPVYKTSDESRFVMWMRQLLIWEDGDELWLGRGVPRAWFEEGKTIRIENAATHFGLAGLVIHSEAKSGRIHARIVLPTRTPPEATWLRLRHPDGKTPRRVTVNGRVLDSKHVLGEDIRLPRDAVGGSATVEVVAEYENGAE
jgi:hypothetical protein